MAEFCRDCWNKMGRYRDYKWMYEYEWGLCEGCGEYKYIVCGELGYFKDFRFLLIDLFRLTVRLIWYCLRKLLEFIVQKIVKRKK